MVVVYDMGEDRNVPGTWIVLSPLEYQFFDTESVSGVAAYYDAKINEIGHSLAIVATGTKELMMWLLSMTWGRTGMCLDWFFSSPT